ncbi:MAG: 4-hydroxy-3-methylbut-2-enyl diphosphate reductase [Candidatus Omnitrophota bacterium]
MKIHVAKSAGFCFGVKRALEITLETAKKNKSVYMLGDIVHNEDVIKTIQKAGIKKVSRLTCGKNKTLIIRAHGASLKIFQNAEKKGYNIIDATCPMVKEIHKIVKKCENEGYQIIIIGEKKHHEVLGITGQLKNKALTIGCTQALPLNKIKKIKKTAVVVQSTQDLTRVTKMMDRLKKHIPQLKFFNTICGPTRIKQAEIQKLPLENDIMLIIGSKTSANTKRLYEISKTLNKKSYLVQSKKDLKRAWFKNITSVGITSGASTPQNTTNDVVRYIQEKACS